MEKNKKQRIITYFVIVLLVITSSVFANVEEIDKEIHSKEDELEQNEKAIEAINENVNKSNEILNELNIKIYRTTEKITKLESEIDEISAEIEKTQAEITLKEQDIKQTQAETDRLRDLLHKRLRVMYKAGSVGYLEVLFGADSMQELLSRADILQKIVANDQALIDDLEAQRLVLENKKKDLQYKKEHYEALLGQRVGKKEEQNRALGDLYVYSQQVQQDISAMEEQIAIKLQESEAIRQVIEQLERSKEVYVGGSMAWPVPSSYLITSPFGPRPELIYLGAPYFHTGTDIGASTGEEVRAAQTGKVVRAEYNTGYGNVVVIDHGGGIFTVYAHLNAIYVDLNQEVEVNEVIGEIGSTGISTGPHLHFEVREEGTPVEPMEYIGQYVGW